MKPKHILTLGICIALPLAVGGIAGYATTGGLTAWYSQLVKPAFNPPSWLFGPVWTLLYLLMGISLFLIWRSSPGRGRTLALVVFGIQLVLNFAWSFLFFNFRQPGWAFAEILLLWACIAAMIPAFGRISRTAAWLQVPYLLWVTFAAVLNGAIWLLNK